MARRNKRETEENGEDKEGRLGGETKRSLVALAFLGLAIILVLSGLDRAGPGGNFIYAILTRFFGIGYFLLPAMLLIVSGVLLSSKNKKIWGVTLLGATLLVLSTLGLIELTLKGRGGWLGLLLGSLKSIFGSTASAIINIVILTASILIILNVPLIKISWPKKTALTESEEKEVKEAIHENEDEDEEKREKEETEEGGVLKKEKLKPLQLFRSKKLVPQALKNYVFPPLSLLKSATEKPGTGDLRANANIIKRTLENFGMAVEMSEVNIGPTVTRYTLKPAEGVKLSKITALNQDLALALAAHPIRIEAPIPGKSLVGIEVPNRAAALVRLGSLMSYPEFQNSGLLTFALGRDVNGDPILADIEDMPHLLIAGATGSGKSVVIHSLITSLLYKNSPATLKLVLIDPKRVELSVYEGLPHLVSPIITHSKKAAAVFRWVLSEMERRYELLESAGRRDIQGYNKDNSRDPIPYLLIIVDELADLMTSYGREVEGSVIRLAQMARATGLHLVLSTQRPSVEVLTGLIKANITSRIALQVASQVDSRTILDASGAEKLLGGGDLLFISAKLSKPKRIQGSYVSEEEILRVVDFIKDENRVREESQAIDFNGDTSALSEDIFEGSSEEDELYEEAVEVVVRAKKASASLLQRRLKVGYARAARLLDLMEEAGVVGPGEGAKPREVFLERIPDKRS
ncbi:MAG: hypothetical protein HYT13_00680 [Candidatus Liptonbacteria bacterium]|nr:hypothetical protein [Candidatus Liptonbacteria bacterium]